MKRFAYLVLMLFMLASCDFVDDTIDSLGGDDDDDSTDIAATATTDTTSSTSSTSSDSSATPSKKYHHYNPNAYEMSSKAVSFVLCKGQSFKSCKIGDKTFTLHGNQDEGRDAWIYYGAKKLSGTIICKNSSGKSYSHKVSGSGGMQYGSCK